MTRTFLQASTTKTAAFDGSSYDASVIDPTDTDFTIFLRITHLIGAAQVAIESSVDAFTAHVVRATVNVKGDIIPDPQDPFATTFSELKFHWKSNELSSMPAGTAGDVWRVSVTELTGNNKTITYQSWVEYN